VNKQANKAEEAVRKGYVKELYIITRKLSNRKYRGAIYKKQRWGSAYK
jgi:hypothetical protein